MKKQNILMKRISVIILTEAIIIGLLIVSNSAQTLQTTNSSRYSSNKIGANLLEKLDSVDRLYLGKDDNFDFANSYFNKQSIPVFNPFNNVAGGLAPPFVNKIFGSSSLPPGGLTVLTYNFSNVNSNPINPGGSFIFGLGIADSLPAGMTVFSSGANTCGGTVIAQPNTNFIVLSNGIIQPGGNCTFSVVIRATIPGPKISTSQPATSGNAGSGNTATATLTVTCPTRFTVDNLNDNIVDTSPGDGICATNFPGSAGGCSLRAAIQEANSVSNFCPANYSINFQVPGTIRLLQGLLTINSGKNVTINGLGANSLTVSGEGNSGVFSNNGIATISNLTITDGDVTGTVGGTGGGLRSSGITTVRDAVITGNSARTGGGIAATGGSLTLVRTTVSGNTADDAGGIYAENAITSVRDSTVSGNSGTSGEGLRNNASSQNSTMTLTNSTVSGNTTTAQNSAIRSEATTGFTSTINLTNITVTNNSTTNSGQNGAIWLRSLGGTNSVTLKNTIVSGNTSGGSPFDIEGNVDTNSSFNLIGTGGNLLNGINSNIVGINNPLVGMLANNGGTTQTNALLTGSPAIDKGSAAAGITTDQRGSVRPVDVPAIPNATGGNGSDIGAFESNSLSAPPTFTSADNASFQLNSPGSFTIQTFANPTATISLNGVLPSGVNFVNNGNGTATLSGTPVSNAAGVYQFILTASNGINPNATQNFTLTVPVPVDFTSSPFTTFRVGVINSYTITTLGVPTPTVSRIAGNLPQGLFYTDNGNGTATIGGNPVAGSGGIYTLTISADNGVSAEVLQNFVLTINETAVFTSPDRAAFRVNAPGSFFVRARGYPSPVYLSVNSGTLPGSITFNQTTGEFSGTPGIADIGSYPLTLQAQTGVSPDAFQSFVLNVCQIVDITVNSSAQTGTGSLRQAIIDACPGSTITIAPGVTGQINLTTPLMIEKDINIVGPGANVLALRGVSNRIITVGNNVVNISGLTISNGNSNFFGGAIINNGILTLKNVVVSNSNAVNEGGAIYNSAILSLDSCTLSGNRSQSIGGAIYSFGTLNVVNTTISGNNAGASGGGIFADGTLNITNATITNNRADSDGNGNGLGGGIFNNNLAGNGNLVTLRNNIVAGNFLRPSFSNPTPNDLDGTVFPNAFYNLIGNASTSGGIGNNSNGNIVGNNGSGTISISTVIETTLTDNGGTTPTHRLPATSPAVDKGSAASTNLAEFLLPPVNTDQRGITRPYDNPLIGNANSGDGSDIGAFELQAPTAAAVSVSGKVLTSDGRGLRNAIVILTDSGGNQRQARTSSFGYFLFDEIRVGETYIFEIKSKQYIFDSQVISVTDEISDLNFIALP